MVRRKKVGKASTTTVKDFPSSNNWEKLKQKLSPVKKNSRKTKTSNHLNLSHLPVSKPPSSCLVNETSPSSTSLSVAQITENSLPISNNITVRLALDCEMVGAGKGGIENHLARVSIVNVYGEVVYDQIVTPREKVTDYRTHITGITSKIISDRGIKFEDAQQQVANMIKDKIVIGHDIQHDFKVLGFSHPKSLIRDTAKYKPFKDISMGKTPSLKKLCDHLLKKTIQEGEHDSIEDSRCALELYKRHRPAWERGVKKRAKLRKQRAAADEESSDDDALDD